MEPCVSTDMTASMRSYGRIKYAYKCNNCGVDNYYDRFHTDEEEKYMKLYEELECMI